MWQRRVEEVALEVRRRAFEHSLRRHGGYLSQACSAAEILSVLYLELLQLDGSEAPKSPLPYPGPPRFDRSISRPGGAYHGPRGPHLDRLIVSAGRYALALYAVLAEVGRISPTALRRFAAEGGGLDEIGAPHCPGFEVPAGVPGQGIATAVGIAQGRKLRGENGRVWVFAEAAEFDRPLVLDALRLACQQQLSNLALFIDHRAGSAPRLPEKLEALEMLGATTVAVPGHDPMSLVAAGRTQVDLGPLLVRAETDPARGIQALQTLTSSLERVSLPASRATIRLEAAIRAELFTKTPSLLQERVERERPAQ
ncbi:MAG: transketolase [Myxococcota bacterium]|nr:transketolase [Myxococcota bacterium]